MQATSCSFCSFASLFSGALVLAGWTCLNGDWARRYLERSYTAGLILFVLAAGFLIVLLIGGCALASVGWIRKENPRWVTYIALGLQIEATLYVRHALKG